MLNPFTINTGALYCRFRLVNQLLYGEWRLHDNAPQVGFLQAVEVVFDGLVGVPRSREVDLVCRHLIRCWHAVCISESCEDITDTLVSLVVGRSNTVCPFVLFRYCDI